MDDLPGKWVALYMQLGSLETEILDSKDEALRFLEEGQAMDEFRYVSLHGPDTKMGEHAIAAELQRRYEIEHAEEIAEAARRRERIQREHEEWLAKQPPWKREFLNDVEVLDEQGYTRVVLQGIELPFKVFGESIEYIFESGNVPFLRMEIPLGNNISVESIPHSYGFKIKPVSARSEK